jgi:hypothetical protein
MEKDLKLPSELVTRIMPEAERRAQDIETVAIELLWERLTPPQEVLLRDYSEVCTSHKAITDFRAKLLALLPIASGAAVGVLGFTAKNSGGLLVALGVFGMVVTIGLFMYEVRQIDLCKQLRNHAEWIEGRLGIEVGQFGGRRPHLKVRQLYGGEARRSREDRLRSQEVNGTVDKAKAVDKAEIVDKAEPGLVGAETAGYIIYHAVIVAWLALALFGLGQLLGWL